MERKQWILVVIAFLLAGIYVVYFTDWFRHKSIQIHYTSRPMPSRIPRGAASPMVMFGFDKNFRLTEVKVVLLAEWQTNRDTPPVWHLISDSKSAPVERFIYGQNIRGMKPAIPGAQAELLESNLTYRIFVQAGSLKGQRDFQIGVHPSGEQQPPGQTPMQ
ncbi:MAG: hypothetical protein ABR955_12715 [Verrucomicrobiota bacterium]|jgi:hypothetical protein